MFVLSWLWRWFKRLAILFFIVSFCGVLVFKWIPVPFTWLYLIRASEQIGEGKSPLWSRDWTPLEDISPEMVKAVICAEDQNFMNHYGFDWEAIQKAWKSNEKGKSKITKGASTISQQTAKNVFLWPGRTWIRKGLEAYFTVLIELIWGKKRILEVYLNVIEMGNSIYGCEAAAQKYYHKSCTKLNRGESAMIAAILPNPRKLNPLQPDFRLYKKQQRVLNGMKKLSRLNF